jgi:hypothetical protein
MKSVCFGLSLLCSLAGSLLAQSGVSAASGNGPLVVPTSAAYAELTNAANAILADIKVNFPSANTVVIYDAQTFALLPYYQSGFQQLQQAMSNLCQAEGKQIAPHVQAPGVGDIGAAATGLASLVAVTLPALTIQGQEVKIDQSAFVAAFSASASTRGLRIFNPAYLLPATRSNRSFTCSDYHQTTSFADLWTAAAAEADTVPANPASPALKTALAQYRKLADAYLAAEKGPSLLNKLLMAESLAGAIPDPATSVVVDMRLDAVGIDSTTRTILWWHSTKFSSNVIAHYTLLRPERQNQTIRLTVVKPGYVNVMLKNVNQNRFATSASVEGAINGKPVPPSK